MISKLVAELKARQQELEQGAFRTPPKSLDELQFRAGQWKVLTELQTFIKDLSHQEDDRE